MEGNMGSDSEFDGDLQVGRITYGAFLVACEGFVRRVEEASEAWKLDGDGLEMGGRYLTMVQTRKTTDLKTCDRESCPQSVSTSSQSLILCRYDVLYSVSHSVPVLYFNMSRSDGTPIPLQEIWDMCSSSVNLKTAYQDMWSIISQQDHPVLNTPFYFVHPCHSWKLMAECFQKQKINPENYLISWLSIFGVPFGIKLPNSLLH